MSSQRSPSAGYETAPQIYGSVLGRFGKTVGMQKLSMRHLTLLTIAGFVVTVSVDIL